MNAPPEAEHLDKMTETTKLKELSGYRHGHKIGAATYANGRRLGPSDTRPYAGEPEGYSEGVRDGYAEAKAAGPVRSAGPVPRLSAQPAPAAKAKVPAAKPTVPTVPTVTREQTVFGSKAVKGHEQLARAALAAFPTATGAQVVAFLPRASAAATADVEAGYARAQEAAEREQAAKRAENGPALAVTELWKRARSTSPGKGVSR